MATLPEIVAAPKALSLFPGWSEAEPETGYIWFDAPLEIGGVTEAGLVLHGGTFLDKPDCHVTFELVVRNIAGRRRVPLYRVDWRSLTGGHRNRRNGPPKLAGKRVGHTHVHSFENNWVEDLGRMRGRNLPIAAPIDEQLQTFEDVRQYAGKQFGINNIELVTRPEWEYDLYYEPGIWD